MSTFYNNIALVDHTVIQEGNKNFENKITDMNDIREINTMITYKCVSTVEIADHVTVV